MRIEALSLQLHVTFTEGRNSLCTLAFSSGPSAVWLLVNMWGVSIGPEGETEAVALGNLTCYGNSG